MLNIKVEPDLIIGIGGVAGRRASMRRTQGSSRACWSVSRLA
jgi:hypothetical protein